MLAAEHGHLHVLKYLAEERGLEQAVKGKWSQSVSMHNLRAAHGQTCCHLQSLLELLRSSKGRSER